MLERIVISLFGLFVVWNAAPAAGQPGPFPPWYDVIRIAEQPYVEESPRINNRRQVVYTSRLGAVLEAARTELFLYDAASGATTRLTNNQIADFSPRFNDVGTIAWVRWFETPPVNPDWFEIMLRDAGGVETRLTQNDQEDLVGGINNLGQVASSRCFRRGCVNDASDIFFFDGVLTHRITDNEWTNDSPSVNEAGQIAFVEEDICGGFRNWRSDIKLFSDGQISTLTQSRIQSQSVSINDHGIVAWSFLDPQTGERGIRIWDNGLSRVLINDPVNSPINPVINERGDIAFNRWHEDLDTWECWLYHDERFYQLTETPGTWNTDQRINDLGDIVWVHGNFPSFDIWLALRRFGDLNCDGAVNAFDIDPFVLALFEVDRYGHIHGDCDPTLADINHDDAVDAFDIEPFVDLLFP